MLRLFKKLDRYLLLNHPNMWSTKIHKVLLIWLLGFVVLTALFMLQSIDSYSYGNHEVAMPWLVLLAICGVIFWLVFLFRFNVFKSFGNRPKLDEWKNFAIIFTGILLITGITQSLDFARYLKVRITLPDSKIERAINAINVYKAMNRELKNTQVICKADYADDKDFYRAKANQMEVADSFFTNDSNCTTFFRYNFEEEFFHAYSYNSPQKSELELLGRKAIIAKVNALKNKKDTLALLVEFCSALNAIGPWKYDADYMYKNSGYFVTSSPRYYDRVTALGATPEKEAYNKIYNTIRKSGEYRDFFHWHSWEYRLRIWLYFAFYISLLILIFRNSTRKTFLISLATAAMMPLLVAVFTLAIGGFGNDGNNVFVIMFLFYLAFAALSIAIAFARKRSIFQGIALNLFTLASPLLFVFFEFWDFANSRYKSSYGRFEDEIFSAEVLGVLVFLILLQPLFKFLYVRWYSLPEQ